METGTAHTREPRRAATGRNHSPTRESLLRLIEEQQSPISITALAGATGWHVNTVRGHVIALWEDGYLARSRADQTTPGRPSWLWSAQHRLPDQPYAALARVLAEALTQQSPDAAHTAREAGRHWGLALGSELPETMDSVQAREQLIAVTRDQGFAPHESGGSAPDHPGDITLRQCPLIDAASAHPEVVCAVHLGMVSGILQAIGSTDLESTLTPFSAPGECTLRLQPQNQSQPRLDSQHKLRSTGGIA